MLSNLNNSNDTPDRSDFVFLVILGLIFAIHLTLYWRYVNNINQFIIQTIIYISLFFKLYQKQNQVNLSSSTWSRIVGLLIIFPLLLRAKFLLSIEASIFWYFLPILSIIGYILLIAGFNGIKQFRQELIIIIVITIVIYILIPKFSFAIFSEEKYRNSIIIILAKSTSFLLWYLGFNSITSDSIVYVNGAAIDILPGCMGWDLFIILIQLSLCISFLFSSLIKNPLLPFLVPVVISFVLSTSRLVIMALVVNDKAAFHYWHGHQGGDIFTFMGMLLFWGLIFLNIPSSFSLRIVPPNPSFRVSSFFWVTAIILGIVLFDFILGFAPVAGANRIATYEFPSQIPLAGWNFVDSHSSTLIAKVNDRTRTEEVNRNVDNFNTILANRIYNYANDNNSLTINARYLINTFGSINNYHQDFEGLPNLKNAIEKQGNYGPYLSFVSNNQLSFIACVNFKGKTTVTESQFLQYFRQSYFQISELFNWVIGKRLLQDRRCLWLEASINNQNNDESNQLMTVWSSLISYWQKNFPPLRN